MTRVDFYVVEDNSGTGWLKLVCRLTEKAFAQGHQVCIAVDSSEDALTLDKLLWTFRDRSFIPHAIHEASAPADEPVLIAPGALPAMRDVLINLRIGVPPEHGEFARVVEALDADPVRRKQGRQRFRRYREAGLDPETHNLAANHA